MDVRRNIKSRKGKNSGELSDTQKTSTRMQQWAFPSFLCNLLSKTINGETNCVVIMCVSPSPFNGSETAFTIGELNLLMIYLLKKIIYLFRIR